MRERVIEALLDPIVTDTAVQMILDWRPPTTAYGVYKMLGWVKRHFFLINEPIERLHSPAWQLRRVAAGELMFGDCDDAAMVIAALLMAVGLPARFVGIRPPGQVDFMHVFTEFFFDDAWRVVDTTSRRQPPADWERMVLEI